MEGIGKFRNPGLGDLAGFLGVTAREVSAVAAGRGQR